MLALIPEFANPLFWVLAFPLGGAGFLAVLPSWRQAGLINVAISVGTFAGSSIARNRPGFCSSTISTSTWWR